MKDIPISWKLGIDINQSVSMDDKLSEVIIQPAMGGGP
jgi:hypothetical protein